MAQQYDSMLNTPRRLPQPPCKPRIFSCDTPGSDPTKPLHCVMEMACTLDRAQIEAFFKASGYKIWKIIPVQEGLHANFGLPWTSTLVRIPKDHIELFMEKFDEHFRGGVSSAVSATN